MSVPSRTACRVAERRAAHQLLDTPLILGMARLASGTEVVFDYAISPELLAPIERLVFDELPDGSRRRASLGSPGSIRASCSRRCSTPDSRESTLSGPTT